MLIEARENADTGTIVTNVVNFGSQIPVEERSDIFRRFVKGRSGPGTDYDKIGQVPASTGVTALGTNEDGSWVVVNYNGTYGWLKTEFLNG